jgi:hypothetical protein
MRPQTIRRKAPPHEEQPLPETCVLYNHLAIGWSMPRCIAGSARPFGLCALVDHPDRDVHRFVMVRQGIGIMWHRSS